MREAGIWCQRCSETFSSLVSRCRSCRGLTGGIAYCFIGIGLPLLYPLLGVVHIAVMAGFGILGVQLVLAKDVGSHGSARDRGVPAVGPKAVEPVYPITFARGGDGAERFDLGSPLQAWQLV